eukprot:CAMPEP_0184328222 /NCGR_PEP_ID=MMETSP1049-20130417/143508_1 /TAXON_ID=77928 /ORGANISM="Proteomonas sulcata, Strain CCMP704" /LENGTH=549 /DNA_ID=CAMNT_0026650521 /DNA_START=100 /DNA_END=1751 /DNA_ORIENTATION=-
MGVEEQKAEAKELQLQRAAKTGNLKLLHSLLVQGARVNAHDVDGWTCLHAAAAAGQFEVLRAVIEQSKPNINLQTKDGRTPLYFAALDGKLEAVEFLLGLGANPHLLTTEGSSAKDVAALFKHTQVEEILAEALTHPPPQDHGAEDSGVRQQLDELRNKAERYIEPKGEEWKKTDFGKWSRMKDEDWEAFEAHHELNSRSKEQAPAKAASALGKESNSQALRSSGDQPLRSRKELPYGRGRIGPPKVPEADHPRFQDYQQWLQIKKDIQGSKKGIKEPTNDKLYSLRQEPEGGALLNPSAPQPLSPSAPQTFCTRSPLGSLTPVLFSPSAPYPLTPQVLRLGTRPSTSASPLEPQTPTLTTLNPKPKRLCAKSRRSTKLAVHFQIKEPTNDKLYSLRQEPEGGANPDKHNGCHGPGYTWGQSPTEIWIWVRVPPGTTKQSVVYELSPVDISLSIKQPNTKRRDIIFHAARLWKKVKCEESFWSLEDGRFLTVILQKQFSEWWRCVTDLDGHIKIDSTLCRGFDVLSEYEEGEQKELRQFFDKQLNKRFM